MPISIKIDCTLIVKAKLFQGKKPNADNKLPQYLDAILIETPGNQYADFMIVQSISKEEKERGVKQGKKLGTGKWFGTNRGGQQQSGGSNQSERSLEDLM